MFTSKLLESQIWNNPPDDVDEFVNTLESDVT